MIAQYHSPPPLLPLVSSPPLLSFSGRRFDAPAPQLPSAAESTRREIEKLQAREAQQTSNALRLLRDALPTVEGMLQSAPQQLTQREPGEEVRVRRVRVVLAVGLLRGGRGQHRRQLELRAAPQARVPPKT